MNRDHESLLSSQSPQCIIGTCWRLPNERCSNYPPCRMAMSTREILEMIISFLECCICLGRFILEGVPLCIPGAAFVSFKGCAAAGAGRKTLFPDSLCPQKPTWAVCHQDRVTGKGGDSDPPWLQWVVHKHTVGLQDFLECSSPLLASFSK